MYLVFVAVSNKSTPSLLRRDSNMSFWSIESQLEARVWIRFSVRRRGKSSHIILSKLAKNHQSLRKLTRHFNGKRIVYALISWI